MIYKGIALGPDGIPHKFSSNDEFHTLDGLKLDRLMFAANISSQADVEALIDFLQIAKLSLDKKNNPMLAAILDEMKEIYDHFEKDHIYNIEDLDKEFPVRKRYVDPLDPEKIKFIKDNE